MSPLAPLRTRIRALAHAPETDVLTDLIAEAGPDTATRAAAARRGARLVRGLREDSAPGLMEVFLAEYGLSTREGIALMCLAEALLRVPDAETMDALIEDKIAPSEWGAHLGNSSSSLVNASTWALMLTGKVLQDGEGLASVLKGAVRRLGEPVIRVAVGRAMREMGQQFVLGQTMDEALKRGAKMEMKGYTYSFDMLGEAALTQADADDFFAAYQTAIARLAPECRSDDIRDNPGISIKLSALHPRYEVSQTDRVMSELVARTRSLALQAREAGMGLNIDAEEADRLDLSLDVIEAVLRDEALAGWDGFGVVVQSYGKRAAAVIDWLYALAKGLDRKIMLRLVKGAYWDTEIKRAQIEGLADFPVFTRKAATDAAYLCCAAKLLGMTDRIYPQFATHNAHTVGAIIEMSGDPQAFEFQRLHGMGEALHDQVLKANATRCRIYAPVGAHRDLLAYLVRRLLENGANSSFVNQILDDTVAPEEVAADPFSVLETLGENPAVAPPADLFQPERRNSRGWDLRDTDDLAEIDAARTPFQTTRWQAYPLMAGGAPSGPSLEVRNPAQPSDSVGELQETDHTDLEVALGHAMPWSAPAAARSRALNAAADLYEAHFGAMFALLAREAGKTQMDAIAELREAVDFLRYYAAQAETLTAPPRGVFACISPWNFPLAIFTGQIAAALAAGNGVIAKPAEATSLIAFRAVQLLHDAGVPRAALQLRPGAGSVIGAGLSSDPRIAGLCFTGSTATAQRINRAMADNLNPTAPLIAETGGLNAMIVDSTALPEQAIRDILTSAFQSAGQRCSALRMLYVQEDIADPFLNMLYGAMDELVLGDPWALETDLGPVISADAKADIEGHIAEAAAAGRVLKTLPTPETGYFVPPTVIDLPGGIADLEREVFGPVLHVARFAADELDAVVDAVNAKGFGLTFGMHSRIDDRVQAVCARLQVGNTYVNRNQIGAIVGSQPFGGEGLSGTGPKAGGPHYVPRFTRSDTRQEAAGTGRALTLAEVQAALEALPAPNPAPLTATDLPGPTGESNRLATYARGRVLCLGPTAEAAMQQAQIARDLGNATLAVAPGVKDRLDGSVMPEILAQLTGIDAVVIWAEDGALRPLRQALAKRDGALIPLIAEADPAPRLILERHICIDTTAAGGNASLLAASG